MYVVVTNKDNSELEVSAVDLVFSDHLAQIVKMYPGKGNRDKIVLSRQLTNNNIDEFKNLLSKESRNEVFSHTEVNCSL